MANVLSSILAQFQVNHYRNINNISVVGRKAPAPARTFSDLQVKESTIDNLRKCGYEEPTPIQKQAMPIMLQVRNSKQAIWAKPSQFLLLQGRHVLACAPTGSGKTAAFLVPIIEALKAPQKQGFRALILCPTRELASQTQRECVRLSEGIGFRIHIIGKVNKALTQYGAKSNQKYGELSAGLK